VLCVWREGEKNVEDDGPEFVFFNLSLDQSIDRLKGRQASVRSIDRLFKPTNQNPPIDSTAHAHCIYSPLKPNSHHHPRTLHLQHDAAEAVDHGHNVLGGHEVRLEAVDVLARDVEDLVAVIGWGGGGGLVLLWGEGDGVVVMVVLGTFMDWPAGPLHGSKTKSTAHSYHVLL
jgi:hypothetical protein